MATNYGQNATDTPVNAKPATKEPPKEANSAPLYSLYDARMMDQYNSNLNNGFARATSSTITKGARGEFS